MQLDQYEIVAFIRGAHAYPLYWQSSSHTAQVLRLQREPHNGHDRPAVGVVTADGTVVGHVSFNLYPVMSSFLTREFNKGHAEIIGRPVNRGAGYGLEVPCVYRLYGPKKYIQVLQTIAKLRGRSLV